MDILQRIQQNARYIIVNYTFLEECTSFWLIQLGVITALLCLIDWALDPFAEGLLSELPHRSLLKKILMGLLKSVDLVAVVVIIVVLHLICIII